MLSAPNKHSSAVGKRGLGKAQHLFQLLQTQLHSKKPLYNILEKQGIQREVRSTAVWSRFGRRSSPH